MLHLLSTRSVYFYVVGFLILSLINYCPREANKVVHILACKLLRIIALLSIYWEWDPLNFILVQLTDDVTIIWNQ